ncbi:F0F1 ATP synthase subunit gamma [Trueperella sp. LYQ143]|uniref:F0F1 ATP synthase subunit gamma n=1 Tax=unclassified Trueperella TaxID=2630174 RepID=UPI0039836A52
MAGEQRIYKQKIRATQTLEKVFSAMELIAASRVGKARENALGQDPYTRALTDSIAAVASHADEEHPLLNERTDTKRVIVFVVTSDRGMAGAYSASVLREADRLRAELTAQGKEPVLYVYGRRGVSHYGFRGVEVANSWIGESDKPSVETSHEIATEFLNRFLAADEDGGIGELHVVYTRFESMITQRVEVRRMLPVQMVDADDADTEQRALFEFEPSGRALFDALLPMYISQRIHSVLLMAAASELASRQQAMHSATENAQELIQDYTRLANNARQAEITTEITEIISGADSLGK